MRIGDKLSEVLPGGLVHGCRVVRMDADRRIHQWCVALGQPKGGLGGGQVPARDEEALDAGIRGALDDGVPIGVEAFVLKVGVRVD
jgi:hypothetical protein